MKKKLRELRRKKEFVKLCKGALQRNYVYGDLTEILYSKEREIKQDLKKG